MNELFLKSFDTGMDLISSTIALFLAFVLGLTISGIYKLNGTGFSRSNSMSFAFMITTVLITAILISLGNNIVLSLGLIGSLSVIRFRTPVKDPEDMVYLFWSIATGLGCGSGNFIFAIIVVIFVSLVITFFSRQNLYRSVSNGYILIIECDQILSENMDVENLLKSKKIRYKLKSGLIDNDQPQYEMVFELDHTRDSDLIKSVIVEIKKLHWIKKVSLVSADSYSVI